MTNDALEIAGESFNSQGFLSELESFHQAKPYKKRFETCILTRYSGNEKGKP